MARNVNFDLNHPLMEAGLESPVDEESVQECFLKMIAEQSQSEELRDAFELRQLDEDFEDEGRDVPYMGTHGGENRGWRLIQNGSEGDVMPLARDRLPTATEQILSSMPSRTIGYSSGAIISQYYNKTMQLRTRKKRRPTVKDFSRSSRPSIRGFGLDVDSKDSGANELDGLVDNLKSLSIFDRVKMIRAMPLNLKMKRDLKREVLPGKRKTDHKWSRLKSRITIDLRRSMFFWLSFLNSLNVWQVPLKRMSGRFGSAVLSYFLFINILMLLNIFLVLATGAFLVVPQAMFPPELDSKRAAFTGLELLTGAGYFSDSLMYYGYYSNDTLHWSCSDAALNVSSAARLECESKYPSYNMPLAYFFTIGMAFFFTCIFLVYSMSKSFGQSFKLDKYGISAKTFCLWDFMVFKKSSVKLMNENISMQLKELLAEKKRKYDKIFSRLVVHSLAWMICIVSTALCVGGIYFFSDYMHKQKKARGASRSSLQTEASLLALPVLVSLINLLIPGLFNLTSWMEAYVSPSVRTYVGLSRNLMLKVSVLGVLCFHWLGRVADKADNTNYIQATSECWESFVGQELYRFLLIDFIFTLLDTLFGELLWRLFSDKVLKRNRRPEFDVAKNVLDLIYGQTLAWLGVLFTPILPMVQLLKLLLLFYIKMTSVMMNCQASRKPYRVSQMTTIFISLLCFPSFLGASVCVTYTMWNLKPSPYCGPFRGLQTMFKAGKRWMHDLEKENPNLAILARAHTYLVENPFFLFVGALIFLIVIYFYSQKVDGQRKVISLLKEHIEFEATDKKYLIAKVQSVHEKKKRSAKRLTSQHSAC